MKVIIINGVTGVGKSTLAKKVHNAIDVSYLLDIDHVRRNISASKENRDRSRELSFSLALNLVEGCLLNSVDVIIDKMMYTSQSGKYNYVPAIKKVAEKYQADVREIILFASKSTTLKNLSKRGYSPQETNTPKIAAEHWDEFEKYRHKQKNVLQINVEHLTSDEVFASCSDYLLN